MRVQQGCCSRFHWLSSTSTFSMRVSSDIFRRTWHISFENLINGSWSGKIGTTLMCSSATLSHDLLAFEICVWFNVVFERKDSNAASIVIPNVLLRDTFWGIHHNFYVRNPKAILRRTPECDLISRVVIQRSIWESPCSCVSLLKPCSSMKFEFEFKSVSNVSARSINSLQHSK